MCLQEAGAATEEMMSRTLFSFSLSLCCLRTQGKSGLIGWYVNRPPPLPCSQITGLGVGVSLDSASEAALEPPTP